MSSLPWMWSFNGLFNDSANNACWTDLKPIQLLHSEVKSMEKSKVSLSSLSWMLYPL